MGTGRRTPMIERYRLAPQMREYDRLPLVLAPYVTFLSRPDFTSAVVNTDGAGFRVSWAAEGPVDTESWWKRSDRGIVLGGSFVFGVGATRDEHTLVSRLNARTGRSFLNLGVRAGNSTQELIAAIPFLEFADWVVVCSGINNVVVGLQSTGRNELFAPLFNEGMLARVGALSIDDVARAVERPGGARGVATLLRALGRAARRLGAVHPSAPVRGHPVNEDVAIVAARALERQRRDFKVIVRALRRGVPCAFVAQPYAESAGKVLTEEERCLFESADALQGDEWTRLEQWLQREWPAYVGRLREMCRDEGAVFVDLNETAFAGWSYVDRVHMTDDGYDQAAGRIACAIA